MTPTRIRRNLPVGSYGVMDVFPDLVDSTGMKRFMLDESERRRFISSVRVEIVDEDTYMWTDDEDGHVNIGRSYLTQGDETDIYLDILHELVHVKQFREGKELFDTKYEYVERPTEVEAYAFAVEEARRLGLSDARIYDYLQVEWITKSQQDDLASRLGVKASRQKKGF